MERKDFIRLIPVAGISPFVLPYAVNNHFDRAALSDLNPDSSEYWISILLKVASSVLQNLAAGTLKANMPVESAGAERVKYSHLEAFGRTLAGIAPWLELGPDETRE